MKPRIYVGQYGGWWRLTSAEWWVVVADGLAGGYVLPDSALLSRRPPTVGLTVIPNRYGGTDGIYHARNPQDRLYFPLDWTPEDWEQAAEELVAAGQADPRGASMAAR
jgi:hypothetical protein